MSPLRRFHAKSVIFVVFAPLAAPRRRRVVNAHGARDRRGGGSRLAACRDRRRRTPPGGSAGSRAVKSKFMIAAEQPRYPDGLVAATVSRSMLCARQPLRNCGSRGAPCRGAEGRGLAATYPELAGSCCGPVGLGCGHPAGRRRAPNGGAVYRSTPARDLAVTCSTAGLDAPHRPADARRIDPIADLYLYLRDLGGQKVRVSGSPEPRRCGKDLAGCYRMGTLRRALQL
jgi:hypothetical protein